MQDGTNEAQHREAEEIAPHAQQHWAQMQPQRNSTVVKQSSVQAGRSKRTKPDDGWRKGDTFHIDGSGQVTREPTAEEKSQCREVIDQKWWGKARSDGGPRMSSSFRGERVYDPKASGRRISMSWHEPNASPQKTGRANEPASPTAREPADYGVLQAHVQELSESAKTRDFQHDFHMQPPREWTSRHPHKAHQQYQKMQRELLANDDNVDSLTTNAAHKVSLPRESLQSRTRRQIPQAFVHWHDTGPSDDTASTSASTTTSTGSATQARASNGTNAGWKVAMRRADDVFSNPMLQSFIGDEKDGMIRAGVISRRNSATVDKVDEADGKMDVAAGEEPSARNNGDIDTVDDEEQQQANSAGRTCEALYACTSRANVQGESEPVWIESSHGWLCDFSSSAKSKHAVHPHERLQQNSKHTGKAL